MSFRATLVRCLSHHAGSTVGGGVGKTISSSTAAAAAAATGVTPASSNRMLEVTHPPPPHPRFPKRIILMRHGESLGNADENLYAEIPDWKIPLTRRGERQCERAAHDLYTLTKGESIFCYCSPYTRTKESWAIITQYLQDKEDVDLIGVREEPRISEQQFGNFQNPRKVRTAKAERMSFGRFYFRFPNGESGLDVYNRVSSFLATLSRDLLQFQESDADMDKLNIIICTHGLTLRLLLMRYFQLSVDEFEHSYNPQNARLVIMERVQAECEEDDGCETTTAADMMLDQSGPPPNTGRAKPFFRLDEASKEALNLKGDVSSEKPVFFRGDALDQIHYDLKRLR